MIESPAGELAGLETAEKGSFTCPVECLQSHKPIVGLVERTMTSDIAYGDDFQLFWFPNTQYATELWELGERILNSIGDGFEDGDRYKCLLRTRPRVGRN